MMHGRVRAYRLIGWRGQAVADVIQQFLYCSLKIRPLHVVRCTQQTRSRFNTWDSNKDSDWHAARTKDKDTDIDMFLPRAATLCHTWWWLFPRVRRFRENVQSFILCLEISSRTLIPLVMPGSVHSGSASWDDCGRMFHDELRVSSFPDRFPHYGWTAA